MANEFRIIYEDDGYPRELTGSAEIANAVSNGSLTVKTVVTLYRGNVQPTAGTAGSFTDLQSYFETADDDPETANPAPRLSVEQTAHTAPNDPELIVEPLEQEPRDYSIVLTPPPTDTPAPEPARPSRVAEDAQSSQGYEPSGNGPVAGVLILLMIALFGYIYFQSTS